MKRGLNGIVNEQLVCYLHGRIEREIEQAALNTGVAFATLSARIAELLHPLGQRRVESEMPLLPSTTTGNGTPVAALEVVVNSRHNETPQRGNPKIREYWASMTPEERSKEARKRMRKWSPEAKAKWSGTKKKTTAKKANTKVKAKQLKQRVYAARHAAKQKGVPVPPLPSEWVTATH